ALALVSNDQLDQTMEALRDTTGEPLPDGAALIVLLHDDPALPGTACPREAARRLGIACLEPGTLEQLRDAIEQTLYLSRAGRAPVALVVHDQVLRSADTIPIGPNRVAEGIDALIALRLARSRTSRRLQASGTLRTARRLELNEFHGRPSPGERVPVGFIAVGPAVRTIRHLTWIFKLVGRVPVLQLRVLDPLDPAVLDRMLTRCEQVVVLEPRPGSIEDRLLASAEKLRRAGRPVASIWGRVLPPDGDEQESVRATPDDLHPSILARKIIHLLHAVRPLLHVASQLIPVPPAVGMELPPRGAGIGQHAAMGVLRRSLESLEEWLEEGSVLEERGIPRTRLARDGVVPPDPPGRLVITEVWPSGRFQDDGISAVRQATRAERPWIFIVCDFGSEDTQDLERLARGVVPEERAERVRLVTARIDETEALQAALQEAACEERLTLLVVRDGPPPRYDVGAQERSLAEIDRLGFEPQQRLIRQADFACAPRHDQESAADMPPSRDPDRLATVFTAHTLPRRAAGRVRATIRPLLESVEVVRTRPPVQTGRGDRGLPVPTPVHAGQGQWRAHVAGLRGALPGAATLALCEAGRMMGFAVRRTVDPTPVGAGRRAWAQVLFTNPRTGEAPQPLTTRIPFGEADLLLGLDPAEALRAISLDPLLRVAYSRRTLAAVNSGEFTDDAADQRSQQLREHLPAVLEAATRPDGSLLVDVAGACRAWFRTDRVTDLALLGLAYQRGMIPVSVDIMEAAVARVGELGFGRALESFRFGRRLAIDQRLARRPKLDEAEDLEHRVRRIRLLFSRGTNGGRAHADRFGRLVERGLAAMPGLAETEPGRRALNDYVHAIRRCVTWGGIEYAQSFSDLVTALYRADRGDRGRALMRSVILPLAETMLIREPLYVLAMATSPFHRRRVRQRLNVKRARGDKLEKRYLTRFELVAARLRIAIAALRRIIPLDWRGTQRQRELRGLAKDLVARAADAAPRDYDHWDEVFRRLHAIVDNEQMRALPIEELRRTVLGELVAANEEPVIEAEQDPAASAGPGD
ncbi:MAG: hypothetical protein ACYTGR_06830, partial [Planctomycetota bacterium]